MPKGAAWPLGRREPGYQPVPDHVDQGGWPCRGFLLGHRCHLPLPLAVVIIACPGLMPPAPARPVQNVRHAPLSQRHALPEQPADFPSAQADRSPRCALKRAKLVFSPCAPFFGATSVAVAVRTTAKNAWAHMAKVMWRYHPVQLRTS